MIIALLIGRKGSQGFPKKNLYPVMGRPLAAYSMIAAKESHYVDKVYVSTDDEKIMELAKYHDVEIIVRPQALATDTALGEDAFTHGYNLIKSQLSKQGKKIELIVLLFCNVATILADTIDEAIEILRNKTTIDSAVTVSRYNMWSPLRARKIKDDGLLHSFVPFETFKDVNELTCDRDSQGDVWFADMGVSVVRPHCLEQIKNGLLPQKWMGQKIYPIKQWGGCDVDY